MRREIAENAAVAGRLAISNPAKAGSGQLVRVGFYSNINYIKNIVGREQERHFRMDRLKIIPYYTGEKGLEDILKDKKASSMLWLEILLNDGLDWESYLGIEEVNRAYEKACIWYSNFSKLIEGTIKRRPLEAKKGKIDFREYRKFLEALNFVST